MPSILEHALDLAARGFRVFPLIPNDKKPAIDGWQQKATTDELQIRRWWQNNSGYNVGVAAGKWAGEGQLLLWDADVKNGKPGLSSLAELDMLGMPDSFRVSTPSGGFHVYTQMPADAGITVSADRIPDYPGVDIRGPGGYVVGPGSVINGQRYAVAADNPVALAETWLVDLAKSAQGQKREVTSREAVGEIDSVEALLRGAEWLRNGAPEAVEGDGGDHATYIVAARLRDFGLSEPTAFELMSVHWNEAGKASPPWAPEELRRKIENAFAYAQNPQGVSLASAEFEAVPEDSGACAGSRWEIGVKGRSAKIYALDFDTSADMALVAGAEPLIEDMLDVGAMSVMYGASNSGKTFVGLDMGFHIAAGLPWQGRRVSPGLVVHLVLEGGRGFHKRLAALRKQYADAIAGKRVPFLVVPCPIDMRTTGADVRALVKLIRSIAEEYGAPVRLVVIDTLSRALAGGEENGSQDMGAFVTNADALRNGLDCHVMTIHHSGKDAAKGARGHSLLRAATDTEIEIADNEIRTTKQRDMESISPIRFALVGVEIGKLDDGRRVDSCTVKLLTGSEFAPIELSRSATEMWEAFQDAAKDLALQGGRDPADWNDEILTSETWEEAYRALRSEDAEAGKTFSTRYIRKLRSEVVDSGRVLKVQENQWKAAT
ncbi:AAA family ATPase [Aurantimonas sp. A2-1-M11]|uniref:AAA family ATPase n=1 Tax=Aurantimonas sp. A2-1-M11 TaxID=3113712 RepID=UPI002F928DCD